jgi:hypothetical protein
MSVKSATKHYFKSGTLSALPTIAMQGSIEVPATKPGEIFFAGLFPFQTQTVQKGDINGNELR